MDFLNKAITKSEKARDAVIEKYLPTIAKKLREKAGPHIIDLINDDERLDEIIRTTYQALPLPARLAIREDSFGAYIKSHKNAVENALILNEQKMINSPEDQID